jgi:hypothetical protein
MLQFINKFFFAQTCRHLPKCFSSSSKRFSNCMVFCFKFRISDSISSFLPSSASKYARKLTKTFKTSLTALGAAINVFKLRVKILIIQMLYMLQTWFQHSSIFEVMVIDSL